jgi:Uma2 family endonuclease
MTSDPSASSTERHGLRELWLADTASRTLLIYRRQQAAGGFDVQAELDAGHQLTSRVLPGFAATVGELLPARS